MKIVVIGGGSHGWKLVTRLRQHGHETVAAAPDPGAYALVNAAVVIDVAGPPSAEAGAALEFFETSTRTLLAAEAAAGVGHHVVLSAGGIERLPCRGYFPAKGASQEALAGGAALGLPPALFQPVAEDDAIAAISQISAGRPLMGPVEVAGPERFRLDEFFRSALARSDDRRTVVSDRRAAFLGSGLDELTLLPAAD